MAPVPTPSRPGDMTVPPTFGWEDIVGVLAMLSGIALAFLVVVAVAASYTGRADWQGYLGARSGRGEAGSDGADTREGEVPVAG